MKQGWEIKKLGEVCEILCGSTPKRTDKTFWDNGTYPWFTIDDIREQGRHIYKTKQQITKAAWDKMKIFPENTVMLCCTASIGEYAITKIPLTSNQQFNGLVIRDKKYLSPMFLMHYCSTLKTKLKQLSGKATIDFVSGTKVKQIPIPVPPLPVQERIVSELDLLSGIIEKKREQLKELDALAQSIFYDMFGDPITNEKGWEVKKLGEVCEILDHLRVPITKKDRREGCYPYYGASGVQDYIDSYIFDGRYLLVGEDGAKWGANDKSAYIIEGKSWVNNHAHILKINDCLSDKLVEYYLVAKDLQEFVTGAIVPKLTQQALRNIPIPLPHLPLQHQFATKIEAIEKQKELIKQSISETETLFNARMQEHFG